MGVDALLRQLLDSRAELAERVVERIRTEMPQGFAGVPVEEQRAGIEAAIEMIVGMRLGGEHPTTAASARILREIGERRARQGVPVDDLLRAWRMGIEEATNYGRELAATTDAAPNELFDLFQEAFALADEAMVSTASGHRRDSSGDGEGDRRGALVRGAVLGRLGPAELHSGFVAFALDPLATYRVFRARTGGKADAEAINLALESGEGSSERTGLAAQFEREIIGFSCGELPRGEFDLVAIGPERLPAELPDSFRTAGRVLGAAERFGLAGVHDLATAGLHAAVIESPELGSALCERLVAPIMAMPGGSEVLASVSAWLACGMRTDPAAERLFVHPNTVRYRLRRYEELTGVDLRETEDAFRVWWALHREELIAPDTGDDGMPAPLADGNAPASASAPPAPA
jgi:hypothetical protein